MVWKFIGEPDEMLIKEGKKINVKFKGELRPKQKPVVEKYMNHIKTKGSGLLALHTGFGKTCLALNIYITNKIKNNYNCSQRILIKTMD